MQNPCELPTLHDLPNKVMESLYAPSYGQFPPQSGTLPYHTSCLPKASQDVQPSATGFDALLTAVNVASEIDAPTPQARNDSIISRLDRVASHESQQYDPVDAIKGAADKENSTHTNWQSSQNTVHNGLTVPSVGLGISHEHCEATTDPLSLDSHDRGTFSVEENNVMQDAGLNDSTLIDMTTTYGSPIADSNHPLYQPQ